MLTAASATHIKVAVKDDTLGLGARAGRDPLGEPMGLDAFKGLLGRLNGKSDVELKQEQRQRDDVKLARYAAMKFQGVRFVSGGLLTQEKVELPASTPSRKQKKDKSQAAGDFDPTPSHSKTTRKSSKKSRSQGDEADSSVSTSDSKKKTKYKKRKADAETADSSIENSKEESQGDVRRERRPMGRHVIRGRHIAQKKKALLDDQSLNEVSVDFSLWMSCC